VRVTVEVVDGECVVSIGDAGDGVPDCCREAIFDPNDHGGGHGHVRVSNSNRLGLPVSAYLARLMGGDLTYDAEERVFVLRLPAASPGEVRAQEQMIEILIT
jgi:K+-sensing histidine kinase KdpD